MSGTSTGPARQDGEVTREEMIDDLRACGWSEEDLALIPDLSATPEPSGEKSQR